ncbi:MAG: TetR/AcrR family transcriptional regulator [Gammaproteobacteria bacterium]|nr:MAG: TetR/AcrR family transcriptional regulator [Gammaproteobacteria bacterium]
MSTKKKSSQRIKRASTDEQKESRRESILAAARKLVDKPVSELPKVDNISDHCGLAKGTIYIYFKTKEEVFLAVTREEYEKYFDFAKELTLTLKNKTDKTELLADGVVKYITENRRFIFLSSISNNIIEQNIDAEIAFEYKQFISSRLIELGKIFEDTFDLSKGNGNKMLIRLFALIIGIWQLSNPPKKVLKIYKEKGMDEMLPDFEIELKAAMIGLLHGSGLK